MGSSLFPETTDDPLDRLLERFGLRAFRPGQREVIESVLAGRDVLCVMPTGGGKSLCYQAPALFLPGLTLVISPLIALIKDQRDQLARLGLPVAALHGGMEPAQQDRELERVASGEATLLYAAPERFKSQRFVDLIMKVGVKLLAVDEAHCISEWGHDFRPDYARLGWRRRQLGAPTTIALTATATDTVRRDIALQLGLDDPAVFVRGFDRPNLFYRVTETRRKQDKRARLDELLGEVDGSMIIYAASRKACEEVTGDLAAVGHSVGVYHAGMPPDQRRAAQDAFMSGTTKVLVATNAFGMGVDKSDIRAVIHYSMPGTLEAYYQEAGRAGRDGAAAHCELLFSPADRIIQEYFIDNEHPERELVERVLNYLRTSSTDMIEVTRAEMAEQIGGVSEMAVGSCLKILEQAGAIERMGSRGNRAVVRLGVQGPDLADLLPASATTQRKVVRFLQGLAASTGGQECSFYPERACEALGMDRSTLTHALAEIGQRLPIDYVPPFRGSATRLIDRETPFQNIPIDFEALAERKRIEQGKLDRVLDYARSGGCRRIALLAYFGERSEPCGHCDVCEPHRPAARGAGARANRSKAASDGMDAVGDAPTPLALVEALRIVLEGAKELGGRFGKTLLAKTLVGSASKEVTRFGLQRRYAFGRLEGLRQQEVVQLIEALHVAGMLETGGERLRPTVALHRLGLDLLQGRGALPSSLAVTVDVVQKVVAWGAPRGWSASAAPAATSGERASKGTPRRADLVESSATSGPRREATKLTPTRAESQPSPTGEFNETTIPSSLTHRSTASRPTSAPAAPVSHSAIAPRAPSQLHPSVMIEPVDRDRRSPNIPLSREAPSSKTAPTLANARPEFHWTWTLLAAGFSVGECVAIRRLPAETILDHAIQAARAGRELSPDPFLKHPFERSLLQRVEELERLLTVSK